MSQPVSQTKPPTQGSEGVFLIDKPTGITSHDVVDQVRRLTGIRRVGHAGTLDPLATGLLIVLVGRQYTKQQTQFLKQDKEYSCTAQLGIVTDTYDSQGTITQQAPWEEVATITKAQVEQVLPDFKGTITQTVPPFSAVKKAGQKLYQLARKGEISANELPTRKVTVHEFSLVDFDKNPQKDHLEITARLSVSSGTYIRSLIEDLGKKLEVGACVTALRRTRIGIFSVEDAWKIPKNLQKQAALLF